VSGKNPELCERAYCRLPWTHQVSGSENRTQRGWTLRLCADHVRPYQGGGRVDWLARSVQVSPRSPEGRP